MKSHLQSLTVAVLAYSLQTLSAAEISGKVTLKGTPPAERPIPVGATCGPNPKPLTTRFYVTSADGGLGNVFVYIKNPPTGKKYEPPAEAVVLDQNGCEYQPYVMALMTNQKMIIRNSDSFMHNVNSSSSPNKSHQFNIAQPSKGMESTKTFDKPELPLKLLCNVHNWMFAFVGVFDHPYFAVTDKEGKFKLPADLPAGKYTLVAKHMKAGESTQEITVGGDKKTVDFTLSVPAPQ
jgi:hypothetical protein